jgi:SAM-dependent methyltransferase
VISILRSVLDASWAYRLFGSIIGAHSTRATFVSEYVRPQAGQRILDIGCGPGTLVPYLGEAEYVGFDANANYIAAARDRYGGRARFLCERVGPDVARNLPAFDIAIASGVLHHLDDVEATQLIELAHSSLVPGGRLITFDGCYTPNQGWAAQFLLSRDRGRHLRRSDEYVRLASLAFKDVRSTVRTDLLRIPYTHIILECRK